MTHNTNISKGARHCTCYRPAYYAGSCSTLSLFSAHHAVNTVLALGSVACRKTIRINWISYKPLGKHWHPIAAERANQKHRQVGASLVEVMISLLILSMGLLGMAALQGLGTQYGNEAYFRSQAIVQTYDLIDRMRANSAAVAAGRYEQDPIPTTYTVDCIRNECTTGDLANYDLVNWNQLNSELLPNGTGIVTRQDDTYTVQVTWQEDTNDDGTPETRSFSLSARL